MRLIVLNANGRDAPVDYADGPGTFRAGVHPPVNYHAYAAATGGAFHRSVDDVLASVESTSVLLLIRKRVGISLAAARKLKAAGRRVLVAWKESGPQQIAKQLARVGAIAPYRELLELADGIVSPTRTLPPNLARIGRRPPASFIPTPYPLEFEAWDYSVPIPERAGIFIGTREFRVTSRNHHQAIAEAAALAIRADSFVTVIASEGRFGRRMLGALNRGAADGRLRIIEKPLPYDAYLRLMASHRLVLQRDRSGVPGQVAGDALLCRSICVGGNGSIEEIAFPEFAGNAPAAPEALDRLMSDDAKYAVAVADAEDRARAALSYHAVASRLAAFCAETQSAHRT